MESSVEIAADEELTLVRGQFEEFENATSDMRARAEKARDYKDGKQYTSDEEATLKKRKQPIITDNKIHDKVNTLVGIEKQQRSDPRAYPRNPDDEQAAEAATDSLRYIADKSDFNRTVRKPAAENLIVEGLCFGQIVVEKKGKKPNICMESIRWDRGYYDIHAMRYDFQDKGYAGFFTWMDEAEAKRKFTSEAQKAAIESSFSDTSFQANETHDDRPRFRLTANKRKRLQVFEHYHKKDGVWMASKWCVGGWLEEPAPSAYKDDDGEPLCCIEIQALYRDRDGDPYGEVQRYLDLQDEHNKRRSKMLHLLNSKRLIVQKGMLGTPKDPGSIAAARAELHKPDGVLEVNGDVAQVRIEDNLNESAGQWQLLQQTDLALSQAGPNAAIQGLSGAISGRAKQLDQASGTLSLSPIFDALDSWEVRMYRHAWYAAKQFWTSEMWIRVTDDERKLKFVVLNQPILQGDQIAESLKAQNLPPEQKQAILQEVASDPGSQQPVIDPNTQQPAKRNNVAEMDMDIIIDRTMDTVNIQQEQFEGLLEIAKIRPEVPFEVLIEASQLRSDTKKRVLDKLSGADNPQAAEMAQMQKRMAEMELMLKAASLEKTKSEVEKNQAAATESHIDASIKIANASDPETSVTVN